MSFQEFSSHESIGIFKTYKNRIIDFRNFAPDQADIEEIALALSNTCRFGGHCKNFYSVAQHAVLVARELESNDCEPRLVFTGLHHDDTEAYLGDVVKPLKMLLPTYREIEDRFAFALSQAFGTIYPLPAIVHMADRVLFHREDATIRHGLKPPANMPDIQPWKPEKARFEYLSMHEYLADQMNHKQVGSPTK
jgi:hypothetical protein